MNIQSLSSASLFAPEFGEGEPVILLHGSASTSAQWRSMVEYMDGRFRVITPDLPDYGRSPMGASDGEVSLERFARDLLPLIAAEGQPVHLVGHSFGGAVALKTAAMFPGMVASLTLIEPAAFNVIRDQLPGSDFMKAVRTSRAALAEGDAWNGMRAFIDYWNGAGAWDRTSHGLKQRLATAVGQIHRDFAALEADHFDDHDAAGVVCPTLLITGDQSPRDMGLIVDRLERSIPFLRTHVVAEAGHMLPLTDPHIVDPMVADFIAKSAMGWQSYARAA